MQDQSLTVEADKPIDQYPTHLLDVCKMSLL